jgi:hypothetical protein
MHKRSLISEGRSWRSANGFRRYKVSTRPTLTRACDRRPATENVIHLVGNTVAGEPEGIVTLGSYPA